MKIASARKKVVYLGREKKKINNIDTILEITKIVENSKKKMKILEKELWRKIVFMDVTKIYLGKINC